MRRSAKVRLRAHGGHASEAGQRKLPQKGLGQMHDLIAICLIVAALFTQTLQPGRCFIGQKRRDGGKQLNEGGSLYMIPESRLSISYSANSAVARSKPVRSKN